MKNLKSVMMVIAVVALNFTGCASTNVPMGIFDASPPFPPPPPVYGSLEQAKTAQEWAKATREYSKALREFARAKKENERANRERIRNVERIARMRWTSDIWRVSRYRRSRYRRRRYRRRRYRR